MLKRERQAYILHQVNLHNRVLSASLSNEIAVSEDTIRRDLMELSDTGQLVKVHGGALSHSFTNVNRPAEKVYALPEKRIIAAKAAALIQNGMFILTGGGTTIVELAKALTIDLNATFISGSIPAIVEYMHHTNIEVIVLGDKLSKTSQITYGADVMEKLKSFTPDMCILGINALDMEHGITDNDWDVVQLKQHMINSAKKLVCLTISEKINTVQPIHVCSTKKIDTLITELDPNDALLKPFAEAGIKVI
ncbi:MAG: DeoR/GlpR family DNA-binding transcription regulator [Ferruginibacter sp.]